jgi:uncharacterized damage-inducible protein DinB
MLPEVRTFVERATTHRELVEQLLDVIPGEYWFRRAAGEEWSARKHLEHLATAEDLLVEDLQRVIDGATQVWLGGSQDASATARRREEAMQAVAEEPVSALRERMHASREHTLTVLARVDAGHLEATLLVPGVTNPWGEPLRLSLREYLAAWPAHDTEHEAAIRRAITAPPDLSAVALTRRRSPN